MTIQSPNIENFAITLPITEEIRQIAHRFAAQQPSRNKAEQVFLNSIAVSVVNNYLSMLGISTDLAHSDSWNPVMQLCNNVADLDIPELGKLECRPIKSSESSCKIPLEVMDLRIGYLVVQIDDLCRNANILGFTPQVTTEELAIADLQPPESLIDFLHESKGFAVETSGTNLGQWLNGFVQTGWQTVENLLTPGKLTPTYGFRNSKSADSNTVELSATNDSVTRAKLIDLGDRLGELSVVLLVDLRPEAHDNYAVTLRVYPLANKIYLPNGLELKVLEISNEVFLEAQARSRDNYIQLKFSGQSEEVFKIEIILDNLKFSEEFKL